MTLIREVSATARRPPTDRALMLAVRIAVVTLLLLVAGFAIFYYLDQRVDPGPSLASRQVSAAEQAVRASPDNVAARLALARAYESGHRLEEALAQYDEILRADGSHRAALLGRGGVLLTKGDLAGAADCFRAITAAGGKGEFARADPQLEEAHYYLALIASRQAQPEKAITEAMAALRIEPTDSDAWYVLGGARLTAGQAQQAVAAFRQAVLFVPTGWCEPYAGMAAGYRQLADPALTEYAEAMGDHCHRQSDRAAARLEKLVNGPAAVDAMLGLAAVAESRSQPEQAGSWYRQVLTKDPANQTALKALAQLSGTTPAASATAARSSAARASARKA